MLTSAARSRIRTCRWPGNVMVPPRRKVCMQRLSVSGVMPRWSATSLRSIGSEKQPMASWSGCPNNRVSISSRNEATRSSASSRPRITMWKRACSRLRCTRSRTWLDRLGSLAILAFSRRRLSLPWHFGSLLRNPPVAVRATIRNRRRSEQPGDDGAADLRQRWLRRWSVAAQLFSPAPPPSGAGVADRQRRCRSSARADAARSRTGPRSRRAQVPAFELLMHLLAGPARLDGGDQPPQRGPPRQVAEVVLLLAAVAPFADQPEFLARQAGALGVARPVRHAHPHRGEARVERALGAGAPGDAMPALRLQHL